MGLPVDQQTYNDITTLQALLAVPNATTAQTAAWTAALAGFAVVQEDLVSVINTQELLLEPVAGGASTVPGILGQTQPAAAITAIAAFVEATGLLAGSLQQQGYINRAQRNLLEASA